MTGEKDRSLLRKLRRAQRPGVEIWYETVVYAISGRRGSRRTSFPLNTCRGPESREICAQITAPASELAQLQARIGRSTRNST